MLGRALDRMRMGVAKILLSNIYQEAIQQRPCVLRNNAFCFSLGIHSVQDEVGGPRWTLVAACNLDRIRVTPGFRHTESVGSGMLGAREWVDWS